jgi:flagellin-like protein
MIERNLKRLIDQDHAISAVIGTILMIAATVVIGGAVWAAMNAYGGTVPEAGESAQFKVQAFDTDGDRIDDAIRVTYLSGPSGLQPDARLKAGETALTTNATFGSGWSPGDSAVYSVPGTGTAQVTATIVIGQNTVLDQTITLYR